MASGLEAHGVSSAAAQHAASLPPVSILFAAFLGYNPIQHLLGATTLAHLPAHTQAVLAGRSFFPQLISQPFRNGLHEAFAFAIIACLVAAVASWSRGERYVDAGETAPVDALPAPEVRAAVTAADGALPAPARAGR
jgi:hypothetical protein